MLVKILTSPPAGHITHMPRIITSAPPPVLSEAPSFIEFSVDCGSTHPYRTLPNRLWTLCLHFEGHGERVTSDQGTEE